MRDAKLTFSYPVAAGGINQLNIPAASVGGVVAMNFTGTSGSAVAISAQLDYGGLVQNGVTGAAMDANADGAVNASDFVRGQILNPLYVQFGGNYSGLTVNDTLTVELHGSDTSGFTPSATTLLSSFVHTAAATTGNEMVVLNLQSYAKFLRLRIAASAIRAGGAINVTRMHIQTGREGNL